MTGRRGINKTTRNLALVFSAVILTGTVSGCRVSNDEIHGWAQKKSGPKKLTAVLTHDKYPLDLRVEAALTLATMKPRGGRAVGLLGEDGAVGLLDSLVSLTSARREQVIVGMVPRLVEGMKKERSEGATDPSIPYKDATFALLSHDGGSLITNPEAKAELEKALVAWCQTDFEQRFDDTSQLYGVEQVLRLLRADGARHLPNLLAADFKHVAAVSNLVHELGDDATQLEASKRLVAIATFVDSPEWTKQKEEGVRAANKASGLTVTDKQFEKQLEAYQEEEIIRVFGAMKTVGRAPVTEYLIAYAKNEEKSESRRAAALAALEGNLDRKNPDHATFALDFLSNEKAPNALRDLAARRIGELPREQVSTRLYALFSNARWQVRWTAASLLLKMSEAKHLPEFMGELGKVKQMALSEPLSYGPLLHDVKGEDPTAVVARYAGASNPVPVRLSALGYYYAYGDSRDAPGLDQYAKDTAKVPACPPKAESCEWQCVVTEKDKEDKEVRVAKNVQTVGDYVRHCILPSLTSRTPESTQPEPTP